MMQAVDDMMAADFLTATQYSTLDAAVRQALVMLRTGRSIQTPPGKGKAKLIAANGYAGLGPPPVNGHSDSAFADGAEEEGLGFLDALLQARFAGSALAHP